MSSPQGLLTLFLFFVNLVGYSKSLTHMNIYFIGQKGLPSNYGGVETHVTELATRVARAGHRVTAYVRPWYNKNLEGMYNGINLVRLPSVRLKHFDAITHTFVSLLHACIIAPRPDVIHIHGVGPALLAWIPRVLRPNSAVVVTFHCVDANHAKWGWFARLMLRLGERAAVTFAHETITVSKTLAKYIEKDFGKRVSVIPNGIVPHRVATDDILLKPFGLSSGNYILSVARLVPHKEIHTLIKAWKKAKAEKPKALAGMKLAIVGGSTYTDEYVQYLHGLAAGDDSIVFTGYQNGATLKALFAGARFVAHPSAAEGMSIAVLEAMSYGKAVIASDIPENAEIAGEYGILFPLGDIDALAQKIVTLSIDRMEAAAIGHAARQYVEDEYHWDTITEDTLETYKNNIILRFGKLVIR